MLQIITSWIGERESEGAQLLAGFNKVCKNISERWVFDQTAVGTFCIYIIVQNRSVNKGSLHLKLHRKTE